MRRPTHRIPATSAASPLPLSDHDATLAQVAGDLPAGGGHCDSTAFEPHTGRGTFLAGGARDRSAFTHLSETEGNLHARTGGGGSVQLLDVDPDLAHDLDPRRAREAAQRLYARSRTSRAGAGCPRRSRATGRSACSSSTGSCCARPRSATTPRPSCSARATCARLGRRGAGGAPAPHDRLDRARADARRGDRPRPRGPRRAVAGGLRRAARPRRAPCRAPRRAPGHRAPDPRRRPPAGAAVVPRRALGPRRARRRRGLAAAVAPHARGHGRRAPALGHHRARPAHGPRGDRAPRRRRVDPARRRRRSRASERGTRCASSAASPAELAARLSGSTASTGAAPHRGEDGRWTRPPPRPSRARTAPSARRSPRRSCSSTPTTTARARRRPRRTRGTTWS